MASGEKRPAAILAAMSLGMMGGFTGAVSLAYLALGVQVVSWEILAGGSLYAVMGIGGGILALIKPRVAGTLMVLTAIVGYIAEVTFNGDFSGAYILGALFLVTGGALALVGRERRPAIKAALTLGVLAGCMGAKGAYQGIGVFPAEPVIWGLLCSFMAIVGGGMALTKPIIAGILMLSALGGFGAVFIIDAFWLPTRYTDPGWLFIALCAIASLLLIPGVVLALLAARRNGTRKDCPPE